MDAAAVEALEGVTLFEGSSTARGALLEGAAAVSTEGEGGMAVATAGFASTREEAFGAPWLSACSFVLRAFSSSGRLVTNHPMAARTTTMPTT